VEAQRTSTFFCADHPVETIFPAERSGAGKEAGKKGMPDMPRDPEDPQRISEKYRVREALVGDRALLCPLKDGFSR
jgi:hypothetical protein